MVRIVLAISIIASLTVVAFGINDDLGLEVKETQTSVEDSTIVSDSTLVNVKEVKDEAF